MREQFAKKMLSIHSCASLILFSSPSFPNLDTGSVIESQKDPPVYELSWRRRERLVVLLPCVGECQEYDSEMTNQE